MGSKDSPSDVRLGSEVLFELSEVGRHCVEVGSDG